MKKIMFIVTFVLFMFWFSFATTTLINETIDWKKVQVMKVVLDWKSKIVVPVVDNGSSAKSLKSLMESVWWSHAINGWYFCPDESAYSWCGRWTTDWLRVSNGLLYSKHWMDIAPWRSVFGFDQNSNPLKMAERDERVWIEGGRKNDSILAMYNWMMMPTLVKNWKNLAVFNDEMNNDSKQWKAWNKTFICSTEDNLTIYMWYVNNVTFSSLADYLIKTFKCYNAIQLDNWWTKAMIYDEKYVAGPWRNMMDAFVIIEDKNAPKSDTIVSTTNNYTVSTKVKTRIDTIMLVVKDERSKKYSLQEQKNRYQNIVDSFSKIKLQWEQKEMIDYLIYLFKNKLKELN